MSSAVDRWSGQSLMCADQLGVCGHSAPFRDSGHFKGRFSGPCSGQPHFDLDSFAGQLWRSVWGRFSIAKVRDVLEELARFSRSVALGHKMILDC